MSGMHTTTDTKQRVAELLRHVDKFVKGGDLAAAIADVQKAHEMDPQNMYVCAYTERIKVLQQEKQREAASAEARRLAEEADEHKRRAERAIQESEARQRLLQKQAERNLLEEQKKKDDEGHKHADALALYNTELFDVWQDGAASAEEDARLKSFRNNYGIAPEEHFALEAAVKRECYVAAFKRLWSSGSMSPEGASTLAVLRRKFNISAEENEVVELELLQQLQTGKHATARILLLDDDKKLLQTLSESLEDEGFEVKAFETSDEAFQYLKKETVDLILSDVNLETSTMGGFSFYERIREMDHLLKVPFVFLSGLTDEALVCVGKELGADEYLTKPFDLDLLVAVIRGKLKRFENIRRLVFKS